jgi:hypothetical protein
VGWLSPSAEPERKSVSLHHASRYGVADVTSHHEYTMRKAFTSFHRASMLLNQKVRHDQKVVNVFSDSRDMGLVNLTRPRVFSSIVFRVYVWFFVYQQSHHYLVPIIATRCSGVSLALSFASTCTPLSTSSCVIALFPRRAAQYSGVSLSSH